MQLIVEWNCKTAIDVNCDLKENMHM